MLQNNLTTQTAK